MSQITSVSAAGPNGDIQTNNKEQQEGKQKKRKTRTTDNILRDLPQHLPDGEKLLLLCQKHQDVTQELKDATTKSKQYENLSNSLRSERDQLQGERNRLILQKDKIETLCRELQKQNKVVQEESLARTRGEEEKRREVADHFQTSITGIQTQLNEYQSRNLELRRENQELAEKLGQFIKQHDRREEHVKKLLESRDLEVKLAEAKLNKSHCMLDQERLIAKQKITRMEEESKLMQDRMNMHLELEKKLKEQIEFYKTKYQSFNKTVAQSNKLFENAKAEMEKLGKRVKQSERDVVEWRGKWELSQRSLLEVVAEHKKKTEEAESHRKLADRLGGLCRALQAQLFEIRSGNGTMSQLPVSQDTETPKVSCEEVDDELRKDSDERQSPAPNSPDDPVVNETAPSDEAAPTEVTCQSPTPGTEE